jgi:hypothetical protein
MMSPRNRRSSIVVIPPMQICPGDLLVYGKVLSQRKSLLGKQLNLRLCISYLCSKIEFVGDDDVERSQLSV